MNEPQPPAIAKSKDSGIGDEEVLLRNKDQLYLALSSARMGTWDWYPLDHSMHWDERMHSLVWPPQPSADATSSSWR
jgi:hypothetical protein